MDLKKIDKSEDIMDVDEYIRCLTAAVMMAGAECEKKHLADHAAEFASDPVFRFLLKRWMRFDEAERTSLEARMRSKVLQDDAPVFSFEDGSKRAETCFKALIVYSFTHF